jgi:long-chain fatty acid transport protein
MSGKRAGHLNNLDFDAYGGIWRDYAMNIWKETAVVMALITVPLSLTASRLHQEDGIFPNHSAEYVRTLNRNASTEADAAFYNPAGLAFLKGNGLHVMFSSQTYYARKEHSMDYYAIKYDTDPYVQTFHTRSDFESRLPDKYFAETTAPSLPDLDVIWKANRWAAYFDLSVMQAANDMTFSDGIAVMDYGNLAAQETSLAMAVTDILQGYDRSAEAVRNEMYIGVTLGGSYRILDWLSAALGLRYINARGNMKVEVTNISFTVNNVTTYLPPESEWDLETDTEGHGFGVIAGTHFKPGNLYSFLKGLDVSLRYEYYFPMELRKTTRSFKAPSVLEASGQLDVFKDGSQGEDMTYAHGNGSETLKVTYPQSFHIGMAYTVLKNLKVETSGELTLRQYRDLGGREDDYGFGYKAGVCVEWGFHSKIKASLGYLYNDFGIKPDKRNEADQLLSSHSIGGGLGIEVDRNITMSVGMFYMIYQPETVQYIEYTNVSAPTWHAIEKDYDERRFSVAFGITCRFLGSETSSTTGEGKKHLKKVHIK